MNRIPFIAFLVFLLAPEAAESQTNISQVDVFRSTRFSRSFLVADDLYLWTPSLELSHFDVSNPLAPLEVAVLGAGDPGYFDWDVVPLENDLYYVDVDGQTHLYDFTNSSAPVDLGVIAPQLTDCFLGSDGDLYDPVTQTLHRVCGAETPMQIQAWDLSNPLAPVSLWASNIPISPEAYSARVAMRGDYAYITWISFTHDPDSGDFTWYTNFGRFDYTNPASPSLLGSSVIRSGSSSKVGDIWIHDDTLFIQCDSTLRSYAFGPGGSVISLHSLTLPTSMRFGAMRGDELLLVGQETLALVDLANPLSLQLLCDSPITSVPDWIPVLSANASEIFASRNNKGLYVYDFDCAGPFTELAGIDTFVDPDLALVVGEHAFARGFETLWSLGMDSSGQIAPLDHVPVSRYGTIHGLESGYVLHRSGSSLNVFDVQNPEAMSEIGTIPMGYSVYDVESHGPIAAVRGSYNGHQGLYMVDFSNVLAPQQLGVADLTTSYWDVNKYTNMAFTEDAVYLAYGESILVVDVADPNNPSFVQAIATPSAARTRFVLDVALGHLITSKYDSHQVWSLVDPLTPTQLSTLAIPSNGYYRSLNVGSLLIAAGASIAAFDFSDPALPLFLTDFAAGAHEFDLLQIGSAILTFKSGYGFASYLVDSTVPAPIASPTRSLLGQNHPNPFGGSTVIQLRSPVQAPYQMKIFDVAGRLVREWQGPVAPSSFRWNGRDEQGRAVASGVYYYEFRSAGQVESRRMVLRR